LILDKIVEDKKEYLKTMKSLRSSGEIKDMVRELQKNGKFERRSIIDSVREIIRPINIAGRNYGYDGRNHSDRVDRRYPRIPLIAEIKRRSPSGGQMNCAYNLIELAEIYEENGAVAISVLTDEKYFGGCVEDLLRVRESISLPILRKDFIIDEYQVYEAKAFGADIILLIAAILDDKRISDLLKLAHELELEVLIESHTRDELMRSIESGAVLLGVNNRNLDTLVTDLATSEELLPLIPNDRIAVTESGVGSDIDIKRLLEAGAGAFLVGEALLKNENPGGKLAEMVYAGTNE
jgi:indole-3-glycerol phosphate synthase